MTEGSGSIDVSYVAHLARINLSAEEKALFQGQLEHIVSYVKQISSLDLAGIEPMAQAFPVNNVFRKDAVREGLARDKVLDNAPEHDGEQFVVPRIVE